MDPKAYILDTQVILSGTISGEYRNRHVYVNRHHFGDITLRSDGTYGAWKYSLGMGRDFHAYWAALYWILER